MNNFIKRILSSAILIPLLLYSLIVKSYFLYFFLILCFFISIYEWFKIAKTFLLKIIGLIFLILSFYFFFDLSFDTRKILFVILVCVSTDVGGYIFGKFLKGPKLTKISPNKTYAGMFGSYITSIISFLIFKNFFYENITSINNLLILTIMISSISQIGDLIISFFKRKSNLKNTGNIIPGHGGLLDRIDGMIFAIPVFYIIDYLKLINL